MQAFPENSTNHVEMPLQLLLFVDKRPGSRDHIRQVRDFLQDLRVDYPFELQVTDVGEEPYLAEHFRLVATPALIKIHPEPRQTLAGSNLVKQLHHWWPYWQRAAETYLAERREVQTSETSQEVAQEVAQDIAQIETEQMTQPESVSAASETIGTSNAQSKLTFISRPDPASEGEGTGNTVYRKGIRSIVRSAEFIQLSDEIFRLKQEKEELENQLNFKDQIIAMLAHDLRNPLTAASIALETLEMGHNSYEGWTSRLTPALISQLLKHARTQTRAIDRMITDILQAARGSSSEIRIQPHQMDLGCLCLEVIADLRNRTQAKNQTVTTDIPSDLPMVLADGERVRQVLTNLLDNAIKYTPTNGKIEVSILHRTTQKIQVSILDNGPGIPEGNRDRIFEDHFRLKRDEAQEGYGIGLSLCQRIIRAHYGQIWVDSEVGQGSCFNFTLPVFRN